MKKFLEKVFVQNWVGLPVLALTVPILELAVGWTAIALGGTPIDFISLLAGWWTVGLAILLLVVLHGFVSVIYQFGLRKRMLAATRLSQLVIPRRLSSGTRAVGTLCLVALSAAVIIAYVGAPRAELPLQSAILAGLCIGVAGCTLALWAIHMVDFSRVSGLLESKVREQLNKTVGSLRDITEDRWQNLDDLPDQIKDVEDYGERLCKRIDDLTTLLMARPEKFEEFGAVAALYHPDFLPHLSHTYLKLSQLRALNVPPRRIQLLVRRWTAKGLESEYVLVHDISERRPEFVNDEAESMKVIVKEVDKLAGQKPQDKVADGTKENPVDRLYRLAKLRRELNSPVWRIRALKKRATVVVAPNGSLLGINIAEERQFNV